MKKKILVISLISLLVVFGIGAFTFRELTAPKNIFEEIQSAEYSRAKAHKKTVLSGTKYFKSQTATFSKYRSDYTIGEDPFLNSPFSLETGRNALDTIGPIRLFGDFDTILFDEGNQFTSISYSEKLNNAVLTICYSYNSTDYGLGKGLYIFGVITYKKNGGTYSSSNEKLLEKYGLSETKLRKLEADKWQLFLKQWFKAYPQSRFSLNNLGKYKTVYYRGE